MKASLYYKYRYIIAAIAGSTLPFSFAPFNFFWMAPISLSALFLLWKKCPSTESFKLGFIFGFASFSIGLYWIYISIHSFGGVNEFLSIFLLFLLISYLSSYIGIIGWLSTSFFKVSYFNLFIFIIPSTWTLVEWIRSWLFSGFGWLSVGYSQANSWLINLAPVGGLHFMSFFILIISGCLATIIIGANRQKFISAITLISIWTIAFLLEGFQWTKENNKVYSVSIVQGAISQDLKWREDYIIPTLNLYRELIHQTKGSSLVLLPEVAIPIPYEQASNYLNELKYWSEENNSKIMLGILKKNYKDNNYFNALVSLDNEDTFYAKRHIVPFGEYLPLPNFAKKWVKLLNLPYSELAQGPLQQDPIYFYDEQVGVSICYEDVFGAEQLRHFPESTFLINITNDAWFGNSIAPHQHLQISRVRAAEVGRFILRSANTGISAIINEKGKIISSSPEFEPYIVKGEFSGFEGSTLFTLLGNKLIVLCSSMILLFFYFATKFNIRPGT